MDYSQAIIFILMPLAGYLLGSIPFAWIIAHAHGIDLRQAGSKNIGATNLARVLGTKYFFIAFLLDAAKGFVPVLTAALLVSFWNHRAAADVLPPWSPLLTALTAVLGHLFPVWLKFKGGKGVATGFGVVVGFWPLYTVAGLMALGVFALTLMAFRYISVSSMSSATSFAIFVVILGCNHSPALLVDTYLQPAERPVLFAAAWLLAIIIVLKHRGNISRLLHGTEVTVGYRETVKTKSN